MKIKLISTLFTLLACSQANAFAISDMLLVGNKAGNGIFTLSNNDNREPIFVLANVSQVKIANNKLQKVPLTKANFPMWDLAVSPGRTVLKSNESKNFSIKSLCEKNCDVAVDKVYQVNFIPQPYTRKDAEQGKENKVNFLFGFSPYYIIPATVSNVKYDIDYRGGKIHVKNEGNTFLKLHIDRCNFIANKKDCRITNYALAGVDREFALPATLATESIKLLVVNHDESYRKEITLHDGTKK
jgi:hypothetical protein